jgi:hypothetical protein
MTRSVVLMSALLGACTVGEVPIGGGGGDGGTSMDVTAICSPRVASPAQAHQHATAPQGTRAGTGCLDPGCHGPVNPGSSQFGFAGTIYKTIDGAAPAPGVTVHIFKDDTKTSLGSAVTDSAGNFIIRDLTLTAFPYKTLASGCGPVKPNDILPMIGTINNAERNCNSANCHAIPKVNGAGAAYLGD